MFEKLKANLFFHKFLKRPRIEKAYAMVPPTDSWYNTITKVHTSLAEIHRLPHETLSIQSHDQLTLRGIYYPCEGSDVTVICAHGYTSHAEREWAFPGLFYHSLGYNVLIPYQRAHGTSEGKYISFGALEHLDTMAWVDLVNARYPEGKIILHGLSMGGGIVLYLADKEMKNVRCLISDAPSTSIMDFFRNVSGYVFKKNADRIVPYLQQKFRKEFHVEASEFEAEEILAKGKYPLLLAAGSEEKREEIFARLQAQNPQETEILILPGCNHGNGMYKQTELFQSGIRSFISKHLSE